MFFKLSCFQHFLAFPFLSDLLLNSLGVWLSAHNPSSWLSKKHVCVFCFLSCLLSLHLSFVWNYSYYTSTELLAKYKCMPISLFTRNFFPMFSENNIFYLFIILFSPVPPYLCVQSRQLYNHAFYQLIIFSLTNSAPVKHLIIYVGGIYRDPPHPDFCLFPLFVWKFLAFSFNYMHVCSFWVEGKKKKR